MGQQRVVTVPFPMRGLNRRWAYGQQAPDTAFDMLNVRPDESAEQRTRGGTRPGIVRPYPTQVGADEVRLLSQVRAVPTLQAKFWLDEFGDFGSGGLFQNPLWSLPLNGDNEPQYETFIGKTGVRDSNSDSFKSSAVRTAISDLDLTTGYSVRAMTLRGGAPPHGIYTLYVGLDNATPDLAQDALVFQWAWLGPGESGVIFIKSIKAGVVVGSVFDAVFTAAGLTPHLMTFDINPSAGTATALVDGAQVVQLTSITFPLTGGGRVGFSLQADGVFQFTAFDNFVVTYTSTAVAVQLNRNYLVAGSNGGLKRENTDGDDLEAAAAASAANIVVTPPAPQQSIQAVDYLGLLYIADHDEPIASGTDGSATGTALTSGTNLTMGDDVDADNDVVVITAATTATNLGTYLVASGTGGTITLAVAVAQNEGSLTFRVERAPKIYDPIADTLTIWYDPLGAGPPPAADGVIANQPPTGTIAIGTFMDRVVLAGGKNNPQVWFMSARGDPLGWDFSLTNEGAAVAGDDSNAGQIGAPITAMIPSVDDYLLFGSLGSLWIMRGDPTVGGRMDNLSRRIGIVGTEAWCYGPNSQIFFLSRDGLYTIAPGATSYPQSVSEEVLPSALKNIDNVNTHAMLEYDVLRRGIHIHLTKLDSGVGLNYWFDLEIPGFWPFEFGNVNHAPFVTLQYEADKSTSADMILGGRDGYLRRYASSAAVDDATDVEPIVSYVILGPIPLGSAPDREGLIQRIEIILGRLSNPITWKIYVANTAEDAIRKMSEGQHQKTGTTRASTSGGNHSLLSVHHPRVRDYYMVIRLENVNDDRWWFEQFIAIVKDVGRHRSKTV